MPPRRGAIPQDRWVKPVPQLGNRSAFRARTEQVGPTPDVTSMSLAESALRRGGLTPWFTVRTSAQQAEEPRNPGRGGTHGLTSLEKPPARHFPGFLGSS